MQLNSKDVAGTLVIEVSEPKIDASVANQFKDRVSELCGGSPNRVILNLGAVGFLDSSGLGAMVAVRKHLGADCPLELTNLKPPVREVFRLTKMDTVFDIHDDVSTALANAA